MSSRHSIAVLKNIFRYETFYGPAESEDYHPQDVLPPVAYQGDEDTCAAYAVPCALEGRYRTVREWAPTPKSRWRLSERDFLDNLQLLTQKSQSFNMEQCTSVLKDRGIGLHENYEAMDFMNCKTQQYGCRFGIESMDYYDIPMVSGTVKEWQSSETRRIADVQNVINEIHSRGPVLASFYTNPEFGTWSKKSAMELRYNGLTEEEAVATKKQSDTKKQLQHLVALIGFGGIEEDPHFVARNSHGIRWGDKGTFLLEPKCVTSICIPIIRRE